MTTAFRQLMDLLDARERRRFWLLMVLLVVMGLAQMIGVASVMPFLAAMSDPEATAASPWLAPLRTFSGAETPLDVTLLLGLGATLAYVGGLAVKTGGTWALLRWGQMRQWSLSKRVFDAYLARPWPWFLGRHGSDLARSVLDEVTRVVNGVVTPLLSALSHGVISAFLLGLLIAVDPWIALFVGTVIGGGYALVFLVVRRRLAALGIRRLRANEGRFKVAQEGLSGIKEVKVLGLEAGLSRRFSARAREVAEVSAANALLGQLPRHLLDALAFGGMMAVVLALLVAREGDLSAVLPVAGVYALAGSRLAPALQEVYRALADLRFSAPALAALHADVTSAPAAAPPPPGPPIRLSRRLALDGVRVAYPGADRPALDGLTLEIPAGATIGLVGGTGAGKTTVADVILGLLEPEAGALSVDGRRIEGEAAHRAWRRSVGYVPQQIFLTDDTVAANIAFGLPPEAVDMDAVRRAARLAALERFVEEELPQGWDTFVGDRGVRLSGGQRQRIGIARALYHDPDVLVLDEATSALDNLTERAVMEAVDALGGAKTVIMIAHRLTTVRGCDRIFLLERGRVAASGTYEALLETSPAFRRLAVGRAA